MKQTPRSRWQLPAGVEPGTWEYVHSQSIADDYDEYFADHQLFALDDRFLTSWLPTYSGANRPVVADLGCGTGRALFPLLQRGYEGLAVDLSPLMLENVRRKANRDAVQVQCLCANLVQLEGLRDACVDHALCLFSTLGMVKGQGNRAKVLNHCRRILKPGGKLFLHVHNLWCNLWFPGGTRWLIRNGWQCLRESDFELGDKYYPYRGLQNMYLHVFRNQEIRRALLRAGYSIEQMVPLGGTLGAALGYPWLAGRLRASGWWIVAQRKD